MPLVYQQNINEAAKLAVWHIAEAEDFFLKKVPLQNHITHPHKRLQHLAGRYLLTELFPGFPLQLIEIADTKKPFLSNDAYHFSISHCGEYAAVIVSTENRVGVDFEIISEKAGKIKDKFLSAGELAMIGEICNVTPAIFNIQVSTFCWSIKETIFKWYGLGKVDFKQHLIINEIKIDANEFNAHCTFNKEVPVIIVVKGIIFNNNVLTWLVT
ncbi:MAG: 4'-phosphopantetheinyl transferase superfamily protein [Ferruginibacter sp.]